MNYITVTELRTKSSKLIPYLAKISPKKHKNPESRAKIYKHHLSEKYGKSVSWYKLFYRPRFNSAANSNCDLFLTSDKKILGLRFFGKVKVQSNLV